MSKQQRQPWLKWYPDNWRAEPRLKMVSRAARSLWVDMLGLMHEAEPYGFLIVGPVSLSTAALIARVLGDTESEIVPLLAELESAGVFSRAGSADLPDDVAALIPNGIATGTILSRKMLRDQAKRDTNRDNGGKGGNPALKQVRITDGITDGLSEGVKAQRPEARKKEVLPFLRNGAAGDGSDHNGNGAHSKPRDDKNWLWTDGLVWLAKATGRPEAGLRSQLGKWLKAAKDDSTALRGVFQAAQDADVVEPIAWITAALNARAKAAAPFEPGDEHEWRKRFESFKANGEQAWPPKWGGTRPGDHPGHPPHILAEFGFQNGASA